MPFNFVVYGIFNSGVAYVLCRAQHRGRFCLLNWSYTPFSSRKCYRAFSLMWPSSMPIYGNKRNCLHKKRVQLPQDWFGTQTWLPFHCFHVMNDTYLSIQQSSIFSRKRWNKMVFCWKPSYFIFSFRSFLRSMSLCSIEQDKSQTNVSAWVIVSLKNVIRYS